MHEAIKLCVLDESKECDNCNKCNICDLDPNKLCDSCGKCLEIEYNTDYKELKLDGVIENGLDLDEYIFDIEKSENTDVDADISNGNDEIKVEYIEDIPELKAEYDKIIESILKGDPEPKHNHVHDHNCNHNHRKN